MGKRRNSDASEDEGIRKRQQLTSIAQNSFGTLVPGITPWLSSDISSELPPLPPIIKPELEIATFSHPGLGPGPNYETLEWYGDAILEMISTEFVMQIFEDHLPVGRCSQIREQLVRNITLAEYYRQYGFEKKTRLPTDLGSMEQLIRTKPRDRDVIKIQGDVFEAYVGAVVRSDPVNGRANVVTWLKALWGRTIKDQIKQAEKIHEASALRVQEDKSAEGALATPAKEKTPKERLAHMLVIKGIKIRYEDMPCHKKDKNLGLPLYAIGAYLDGWGETNKLLGIGTALKKTEAGAKAANAAMENRKLMKLYASKKKEFLDGIQASREAGAATAEATLQ
ncbi:hypothetical protein FZEAL_190 [Fusarium zealandicum]|uniref:RNase III domain-containing protein n=1 Tax=Fusarium zealandicum TaxID=1053134 RepID=A0A8H4XQ10_9HYPO|nr:hypothetical protein FZEAL_190 [Fusarium zealandicum]